jgi:tetratricopeptide (TPR) repeat protein
LIKKWLSKAKQWLKPSSQPHLSSAAAAATKETSATAEQAKEKPVYPSPAPKETATQTSETNRPSSGPDTAEASNHPPKKETAEDAPATGSDTGRLSPVEADVSVITNRSDDTSERPADGAQVTTPSEKNSESATSDRNQLQEDATPVAKTEHKKRDKTRKKKATDHSSAAVTESLSDTADIAETKKVEGTAAPTALGYRIEKGQLHYQAGDFTFTMPLEEDDQAVLEAAAVKAREALAGLDEGNEKQRKHWEYKPFWSLQIHYRDQAQHFYKLRNQEPDALEKAITCCEKMIRYAPMARHAYRMDPQTSDLPQHYGYKQLAIIREREGNLNEAIRLCNQALEEGWKGDWSQRIERYRKKLETSGS